MHVLSALSLLSVAAVTAVAQLDQINLFANGQQGPILGSSFGIPGANATFDYVVIGGGTAGLTVASRLAQGHFNPSVAVVEAGGFYEVDNGNFSVVPGSAIAFSGSDPNDYHPLIDWGINTSPQPGAGNRVVHYARGKTLGGSSARNFMVYQRPTVGTMQKWADEVDDQSYTFANMLRYFKKSPSYTPPDPALFKDVPNTQTVEDFDSEAGPLKVSFSNSVAPFATWARKALLAIGMDQIDGFNSGRLLGSAFATSTIDPRNAHRSSSEASFLQSELRRGSGLVVYKNTLGQKILFDSDKTATGVQVSTAGTFGSKSVDFTLSARKEVIVSAGAFQSPQLLMVSGVGPCDEISQFGIPCVSNRPGVGRNLQDHVMSGITHRVNFTTASAFANNQTFAALSAQQYLQDASGPLSIFGTGYYGWEKVPEPYRSTLSKQSIQALSAYPDDWPELEWLPLDAHPGDSSNRRTSDPADGHNYASISTALIAPLSRGTVSLAAADMNTLPVVDPQWLIDPTDIELAIVGFKRTRQCWETLVQLGVADPVEYFPGSNVTTDEQIREFLGQTVSPVYHAASTCKMGQEDDNMAVVDSGARVYGVQGLRVVDASSFPFLTPGHPQAMVYALAEKIAEDVLGGQKDSEQSILASLGRMFIRRFHS